MQHQQPPSALKEAAPSSAAYGAVGGGYNFQSTGGGGGGGGGGGPGYDRFEHYRRPPSRPASREQSVDRLHAGEPAMNRVSRPPSRNRTPMQRPPSTAGAAADDFALGLKANGGISNRDPSVGGLRHRQTSGSRPPPGSAFAQHEAPPTSSSAAIGAIPKRTESLYMKIPEGAEMAAAGAKVIK